MPPKRAVPATPAVPPAPKRAKRASDTTATPATPSIATRATAAVMNLITPTSTTKARKKNAGDEDTAQHTTTKKKPSVIESDGKRIYSSRLLTLTCLPAFSRGFFIALGPAADAYYNKESNLIRLRCAEYDRRRSSAESTIRFFDSKKEYLFTLRKHETTLFGKVLEQFRASRVADSQLALQQIQRDLKKIDENMLKYQSDIEHMRTERDNREKEFEEAKSRSENTSGLDRLEAIRKTMLRGGA
ncbi:unnamed protein product [Rhizoctonia solani]|uniref:Uncharacterized protein n=1 Tax=Rhizoctonia solani TaxID=456999 RepID=A0A8H2W4P1_9AGAM|nr:unnamed protein product [Rhizoctonia solani]